MYSAYILKCVDSTYYTGIAKDLAKRVAEHNTSKFGAKYTKGRRPVELVYTSKHKNRSDALKEESRIKSLSRAKKIILIKSNI